MQSSNVNTITTTFYLLDSAGNNVGLLGFYTIPIAQRYAPISRSWFVRNPGFLSGRAAGTSANQDTNSNIAPSSFAIPSGQFKVRIDVTYTSPDLIAVGNFQVNIL